MKAKTKTPKTATRPETESSDKQTAAEERKVKLLIALLCIGLSAVAVVPFFFMGQSKTAAGALELRMPTTHDMFLHYDQMKSFYNGLAAGEIYPRWEEDTNRGFGAPTTSYYPPGVYYLTSAFYAITRDWLRALLDAHILMMVASAAALYFYARQVMSRPAAVTAMAAYIFLPYHIADQYQRGAMAELLVFVWMPLMLLFGERLMRAPVSDEVTAGSRKWSMPRNIAALAASYGAFLWSHPPTAYQVTLGFAVYIGVLAVLQKEWKGIIAIGVALVLGLGLGAAYLLPAAIEQNLIHKEYIAAIWPYHKTYIFVHDLYGSDLHQGFFELTDWIWITGTAIMAVAGTMLLGFKRHLLKSQPALKQRVLLWLVLGAFASFMMTKVSMPLGRLIPMIEIGVFTWRMLAITTLIVAVMAGAFMQAAVEAGRQGLRSERLQFASFAVFIAVGGLVFSAVAVVRPMNSTNVFEPEPEHVNWAMIPSTVAEDFEFPDELPQAELATENNGKVVVEEWKPQHRVIRVAMNEDDELLVHTFNFPGWTANVDGQPAAIRTAEEFSDMAIELAAGSHRVTLDFLETPVRRACRITTLGSAALLVVLVCLPFIARARTRSLSSEARN
ncbi:MAG: hypothetical protein WAV47_07675 [Blastocatellia bacterium]